MEKILIRDKTFRIRNTSSYQRRAGGCLVSVLCVGSPGHGNEVVTQETLLKYPRRRFLAVQSDLMKLIDTK
jgi:hypothetical protein